MAGIMTESLMFVALGFLVAALIAIMIMRLVWRRAVTITARKLALTETSPATKTTTAQPPERRHSGHPASEARIAALEAALAEAEAALAGAITHQDTAAIQDRNAQEEISELRAQIDELADDRNRIAQEFEIERKHRLEWQTRLDELAHNARALINLLDEATAPLNTAPQPASAARADPPTDPDMPGTPVIVPPEQEAITSSLLRFNDNVKQRFGRTPHTTESDVDAKGRHPDKPKEKTLSARIRALQKGIRP